MKTLDYVVIFFKYISKSLRYVQDISHTAVFQVLEGKYKKLLLMFASFKVFLIVSGIITIKMLMKFILRKVKRSKFTIKMIPANILVRI